MDELLAALTDEQHARLPDAIKPLYKKDDKHGLFVLQVKPAENFELAGPGFKQALENERKETRRLKDELGSFRDIDPAKAREALAKWKDIETWSPDEKVKQVVESKLKEQKALLEKERDDEKKRADRYLNGISTSVAQTDLLTALAEHKGNPKLMVPVIMPSIKVVERDGRFVSTVVGPDGIERIGGTNGEPMTVSQLVAEYKKVPDFQPAFSAGGAAGSGSGAANARAAGSPKVLTSPNLDEMSNSIDSIAKGETIVTH